MNKRDGNVALVHLPEIGVRGNTHFPVSDMNNLKIADLMSKFLKEKGKVWIDRSRALSLYRVHEGAACEPCGAKREER